MKGQYEHVLSFALEHPWAVTDAMGSIIASILVRRIAGDEVDPAEIAAATTSRKNLPQARRGSVAVIPIYGVIAPRMNMLSDMSGGTTFEALSQQLAAAVADPDITQIVFDVDSPGGNVAGAAEFAAEVRAARARKPIIASIEHLGASAAYWAISGATKIYASKSSMVGSIGVYAMHDDVSEAMAQKGIKREIFSAGKFKTEKLGDGPLSDEARGHIKALIDGTYRNFTDDVAAGRGVAAKDVRNGYGEGRVISAAEALELGMIDAIRTRAETLQAITGASRPQLSAIIDDPPIAATLQDLPIAADTNQERRNGEHWQYERELLGI